MPRDRQHPAGPQSLLRRVQRPHRRRGDRQRRAAVQGASGSTGEADRDAARRHPRHDAAGSRRARPTLARRATDPARRCSARSWAWPSGGTGRTTSSRSRSPWCWRSPPTRPSAGSPCSPACSPATTTCRTCSPCGAIGRSSPTASGRLALFAGVLLAGRRRGNTNSLIPLFAIGVFTGFTLAQSGLVVHWWRTRPARWRTAPPSTGFGAVVTAVATVVFLVTKFTEVAWVVVVAVPAFVLFFLRVRAYYARTAASSARRSSPLKPQPETLRRHRSRVVVSRLTSSRIVRGALARPGSHRRHGRPPARRMTPDSQICRPGEAWEDWDPGVPLRVLHTEYASVVEPIVALHRRLALERRTSRSSCSSRSPSRSSPLPDPPQPDRPRPLGGAEQPRRRRRRPSLRATGGQGIPHTGTSPTATGQIAPVSRRSAPLPHRIALLDFRRSLSSFACLAAEHLGLPLAATARSAPSRGPSTPCAPAASWLEGRGARCRAMRSASATTASSTSPGGTTWLIRPRDCARPASTRSPVSVSSSATANWMGCSGTRRRRPRTGRA